MTQQLTKPSHLVHQPSPPYNLAIIEELVDKVFDAASISKEEVRKLIMSMSMVDTGTGVFSLPQPDRKTEILLELQIKYRDLIGVQIGRSDAARKYGINDSTICEWEKSELADGSPVVRVYSKGLGRGKQVMIDEGHVAAMVELNKIYRNEGQRTGPLPGFKRRKKEN